MPRTRINDGQVVDESFVSENELNNFFISVVITGTENDTSIITTFDDYFPNRGLITAGSGITIATGTNFVQINSNSASTVSSLNSVTGAITIDGTGEVTVTTDGQVITVSGTPHPADNDTIPNALVGSDGITVTSGSSTTDVAGFRTEFVSASGSLQSDIDAIDSSVTLQEAYDNGDGTISTIAGKPLNLQGTGELTAVSGTFSSSLTVSGIPVSIVDGLSNIIEDLSPQLGANLDLNDFDIFDVTADMKIRNVLSGGDISISTATGGDLNFSTGNGGNVNVNLGINGLLLVDGHINASGVAAISGAYSGDLDVTDGLIVGSGSTADSILRFNSADVIKYIIYWDESTSKLVISGDTRDGTKEYLTIDETEIVINNSGRDRDFRVEGTTGTLLQTDAANNVTALLGNVGIITSSPTEALHVVGSGIFTGDLDVQGELTSPTGTFADSLTVSGLPVAVGHHIETTALALNFPGSGIDGAGDGSENIFWTINYDFDATSVRAKTVSGTLTYSVKFNGVIVEGLDNQTVNTSESVDFATSALSYTATEEITVAISGASSAKDLRLSLDTVRT